MKQKELPEVDLESIREIKRFVDSVGRAIEGTYNVESNELEGVVGFAGMTLSMENPNQKGAGINQEVQFKFEIEIKDIRKAFLVWDDCMEKKAEEIRSEWEADVKMKCAEAKKMASKLHMPSSQDIAQIKRSNLNGPPFGPRRLRG